MALVQKYYNVLVPGTSSPTSSQNWPTDPYGELITDSNVHKLSIEAPPGTMVSINHKLIMIGQSGLYDFDNPDINITTMNFPAQYTYKRNAANTTTAEYKALRRMIRQGFEREYRHDISNFISMENAVSDGDALSKNSSDDPTYQNFCNKIKKIYFEQELNWQDFEGTAETPTLTPTLPSKIFHGLNEVIDEYQEYMKGTITYTTIPLSNLVVNYVTTDTV